MIGGNFALDITVFFRKQAQLNIKPDSIFWLQSGRSAFTLLIILLNLTKNYEVLLPAYHCEEMAKPFLLRGIKTIFYPINKNLQFDLNTLKSTVTSKTKLIIYIPYLGWPQKEAKSLHAWCKQKQIHLVADNVPLTPEKIRIVKTLFQIYSFRKSTGVPSGAILILPENKLKTDFPTVELRPTKKIMESLKLAALFFKLIKLSSISYKLHRVAEDLLDDTPRKISLLAKKMMLYTNWQELADKRRYNAQYLLEKLKQIKNIKPLIDEVPAQSVPLFLPITTKRTKKLIFQ